MANGKEIRISIVSALNAAGINATKRQVEAMSRSVQRSMSDASSGNRKHWADIKAAWDMGCAAIKHAWSGMSAGIKSAFKFESTTIQFKTLLGSMDAAKKHMADLKDLGDTPPFSLDEFAKASRSLMVMSDGALGFRSSLEMIGDAAAATGTPIEQMGHAVGRLYAFIRDGQPLSRATMELRNMGVITPEVAQKLADMQTAGNSNAEIWAEVEAQLKRYNAAMVETEQTGEGLVGAIGSRWDNAVRIFGQALMGAAKNGLEKVLDAAKKLEESGYIELYAEKCGQAFDSIVKNAKPVLSILGTIGNGFKTGFEILGASIGRMTGAIVEGNFSDIFSEAGKAAAEIVDKNYGAQHEEQERRDELRLAEIQAEKIKNARIEAAQREADEKKRIAENLAEAEVKIHARAEEEKAKNARKSAQKSASQQLADLRTQLSEAKTKQADAQAKYDEAWRYYTNPESYRSYLDDQRVEERRRAKYQEDLTKLQRKTDWRTRDDLTLPEKTVRNVALAQEGKQEADENAAKMAEDVSAAAEALQEIKQMLREGGEE